MVNDKSKKERLEAESCLGYPDVPPANTLLAAYANPRGGIAGLNVFLWGTSGGVLRKNGQMSRFLV